MDDPTLQLDHIGMVIAEHGPKRIRALSAWERRFAEEMLERYARYGVGLKLSEKQIAIINSIYNKVSDRPAPYFGVTI